MSTLVTARKAVGLVTALSVTALVVAESVLPGVTVVGGRIDLLVALALALYAGDAALEILAARLDSIEIRFGDGNGGE